MLNSFTFSNTKAGELLSKTLNELKDDGKSQKFTSSILQHYSVGLKSIKIIPNPKIRETIFILWRDYYLDKVKNNGYLPNECKNLLNNVVKARLKILKNN